MYFNFQFDNESGQLKLIFTPTAPNVDQLARDPSLMRGTSLLSKDMSILEEDSTFPAADSTMSLTRGAVDCMALHKKGLYIGGKAS